MHRFLTRLLTALLVLLSSCVSTPNAPRHAAIATAHPLATQAAFRILDQGGNAFDAAVAAASVLGVVEPYGSGLGGGGFWLLRKRDGSTVFIDGREIAPAATNAKRLLEGKNAINGAVAAGIPGQPAALEHIARHYGELPLSTSFRDAIRLARNGFRVDENYQRLAQLRLATLQASPASREIFLHNGQVPERGALVIQPTLANTLETMARQGASSFYDGPLAETILRDVRAAGGTWTADDLRNYKVVERTPLAFDVGYARITTAPPPSSGGIALQQMFGMLAYFEGRKLDDFQRRHLNVEVMRRAYHDRAEWLGDPDFVDVPVAHLTSPGYLRQLAEGIRLDAATPSADLSPARIAPESLQTTHVSIMDSDGNWVSATLSINLPFGSAYTSPSTGILLNNELDDFALQPGVANSYGLVGNHQNALEPGKRPLSSMTPTIIETPNWVAVLGSPGGSRIISMVFLSSQALLTGQTPALAVSAPRYHHQYLPDEVQLEPDALGKEQRFEMEVHGHNLKDVPRPWGNMQLVYWNRHTNQLEAVADPRGRGQGISR